MFWRKSKLIAHVVDEKCSNCCCCVHFCRHKALTSAVVRGKTVTFVDRPEKCSGCGKCLRICPEQAIELIERHV
ncbi:MAG: 4Fe-4S binding protein [Prevotella sp.]|nr:4Fe-4S binding protein [Prevotella sp.]